MGDGEDDQDDQHSDGGRDEDVGDGQAAGAGAGGDDPEDPGDDDDSSSEASVPPARAADASEPGGGDPADKYYTPASPSGKRMARMFRNFCMLNEHDAHALVVYFQIWNETILAEFRQEHWKDTFSQWMSKHPNKDGSERKMIISPPQQDRIKCAAWTFHHARRLNMGPREWNASMLRDAHFEVIRAQREKEEGRRTLLKDVASLTDIPKFTGSGLTAMSRHFRAFDTYLSQRYGYDGHPLDWVIRPDTEPKPVQFRYGYGIPNRFADFSKADELSRLSTLIFRLGGREAPGDFNPVFRRDDEVVLAIARIAFAGSPGEIHFKPKKNGVAQSGRLAYFDCKSQFVGTDTARLECDEARNALQQMRYTGESRNWTWDKHCNKFHMHLNTIDEWAALGVATAIPEQEKISMFLRTISEDCRDKALLTAKEVIECSRDKYLTLQKDVIGHLTSRLKQGKIDNPARRNIAAASSSAYSAEGSRVKRKRGGDSNRGARSAGVRGKLSIENGRVVGTLEGLHYEASIWEAMTKEQRSTVVNLRKEKGQAAKRRRVAQVSTTSPTASETPKLYPYTIQSISRI
jgi:hypothetical protein